MTLLLDYYHPECLKPGAKKDVLTEMWDQICCRRCGCAFCAVF